MPKKEKDPEYEFRKNEQKKQQEALRKQRLAKQLEEESSVERKEKPMKTASDVIDRVKHDSKIDIASFSVVYTDRVYGDQEVPLSLFLTGEDYTDIPQHRIQCFKFYDLVVWDKAKRQDNIFKSTPHSVCTIDDLLAKEDVLKAFRQYRLEQERKSQEKLQQPEQQNLFKQLENIKKRREQLKAQQQKRNKRSLADASDEDEDDNGF